MKKLKLWNQFLLRAVAVFVLLGIFLPLSVEADESDRAVGTDLVEEACKGVVRVYSESGGAAGAGSGFGIGVVGEETDTFITNMHVVGDPMTGRLNDKVYIMLDDEAVRMENGGGTWIPDYEHMIPCEILYATDGYPDFAVIRAEKRIEGRTALALLPSEEAKRSDTVFALGFPGNGDGVNGYTYQAADVEDVIVTKGVVSRFTVWENGAKDTKVIQHEAHINHGNSGGPLITRDGAVIGINTYGFGGQEAMEYSASVYIDYAIEALNELGIYYEVWEENKDVDRKLMAVIGGILIIMAAAAVLGLRKKNGLGNRKRSALVCAAEPDSGYCLQGVSGVFERKSFAIMRNRSVRLGRDASRNELVYPPRTKGISGSHCEITFHGGQVYLQDAGSSWGTFLKGVRIPPDQKVPVHEGDTFYLGHPLESFTVIRKK